MLPQRQPVRGVANVYTEEGEVTVPAVCPECGANLRATDALVHWEYQDHKRYVTLVDVDMEWGGNEAQGDASIPIEWRCAKCDCVLDKGSDEPPAARALKCVEDVRRIIFPEATDEDPEVNGGDAVEAISRLLVEYGFEPTWPTTLYADEDPQPSEGDQ
jgi:hypothetical protein